MTNKDGAVSENNHATTATTDTKTKAELVVPSTDDSTIDPANDCCADAVSEMAVDSADGCPPTSSESSNHDDAAVVVCQNGVCESIATSETRAGSPDSSVQCVGSQQPTIDSNVATTETNGTEAATIQDKSLTSPKMGSVREEDEPMPVPQQPLPPSVPATTSCRCAQQAALIAQLRTCLLKTEARSQRLLRAKDEQLAKITHGLLVLEQRVRRQTEHLTRMLADRERRIAEQERGLSSLLRLNRKMAARLHRQAEAKEEDARRAEKRRRKSRRISWHNEVFVHNGSQLTKTTIKDENNRRAGYIAPAVICRVPRTAIARARTPIGGQLASTAIRSRSMIANHDAELTEEEIEEEECNVDGESAGQLTSSCLNGTTGSCEEDSEEEEEEEEDEDDYNLTSDSLAVDQACDAVDQALEESDTDTSTTTDEVTSHDSRTSRVGATVAMLRHQHSVPSCSGSGGCHSEVDDGARMSLSSSSSLEGATSAVRRDANGRIMESDQTPCQVTSQGDPPNLGVVYNRVMSNHRSVTKPKDVKYKKISRVKSRSLEELRGRLKRHLLHQPASILEGRSVLLEQGEEIV